MIHQWVLSHSLGNNGTNNTILSINLHSFVCLVQLLPILNKSSRSFPPDPSPSRGAFLPPFQAGPPLRCQSSASAQLWPIPLNFWDSSGTSNPVTVRIQIISTRHRQPTAALPRSCEATWKMDESIILLCLQSFKVTSHLSVSLRG